MRYLFLTILSFSTLFSFAQDVDIPDGAFLFVLIYEGIDVNDDHIIQVSEAEAVEYLNMPNKGITSLEGISAFVNLRSLFVNRNRLSGHIDLGDLENLRSLDLAENRITSINLSGLPNLEALTLNKNDIESLDLQGLSKIREVTAGFNLLSEFKASDLPSLFELSLDSNDSLKTLDLRSLPALDNVQCSNCDITELILEELPELDEVNFFNNDNLTSYEFSGFESLRKIRMGGSASLTSLKLIDLPSLKDIDIWRSELEDITFENCPEISIIDIQGNSLSQIDLTNLFKLTSVELNDNQLEDIDLTGLTSLRTIELNDNLITELNLSDLPNVITLEVANNQLESVFIENLPSLKDLELSDNTISTLQLSGLLDLESLNLGNNQLNSIDLSNLPSLTALGLKANLLTEVDLSDLNAIVSISVSNNLLTELEIKDLNALRTFYANENQISTVSISNLPSLTRLELSTNLLSEYEFSNLPELSRFDLSSNQLTNLDINNLIDLRYLTLDDNLLTSITIQNLTRLQELSMQRNKLAEVNLSGLNLLSELELGENELVNFNLHDLPNIKTLNCENNLLSNLQLWNLPRLTTLNCSHNQMERLDIFNLTGLETLDCTNNILKEMDFSTRPVRFVDMSNNALEFINFKNEAAEGNQMQFANNPDLDLICIDEDDFGDIVGKIIIYEMDTEVIRNCALQDPNYYEVSGKSSFDFDLNGCTEDDPLFGNLKLLIKSSDEEICYIATAAGFHNLLLEGEAHTITPLIDEDLYSISPEVASIDFGNLTTRTSKLDFCLTPKVIFNDLEISIVSLSPVRPGFEAEYKLIYSNTGVAPSSGSITLNYDENISELSSSTPLFESNSNGQILWNFDNIAPRETRVIFFNLTMNTPQADPPLRGGEEIKLNAQITHNQQDFDLSNNEFAICQTVVNSFDPNDKLCNEGRAIKPEQIGDYLHYRIRFENTGTASAINVTVIDTIDLERLDVNTLEIVDASHEMTTLIAEENIVNFNFKNIRLPFIDESNDGYVAFKIKPLESLVPFQVISNVASIYFDFNDPIITNIAETTILRDDDNDGYFEDEDCDDNNMDINPNNEEITYNGIDDDCNPETLDDDLDQDGFVLEDDCDDINPNINPNQNEEPYNGIDDDCNPETLDDDLDQDGFVLVDDCDDNNSGINPNQNEEPYNGIDDDCNPETLDDDLDQDGFVLVDDCDDNNSDINPNAEDIPNNGIDEDCDGEDLITSIKNPIESFINIYPNPVFHEINIETDNSFQYSATLFDMNGRFVKSVKNEKKMNVTSLSRGVYVLKITDLDTAGEAVRKIILSK